MICISGGYVLQPDGTQACIPLHLAGGHVAALDDGPGQRLDATGLHVLPGIVDIHGDAFERQMQPRPGVDFPVDLALRDTEAQLLANGITTALHAITLSWEPGLRGPERWRALLDALDAARPTMVCDMRVHLRWEMHNLPALEMALADVEAGRVGLVSFNDHTPSILRRLTDEAYLSKYSERAGVGVAEFIRLAEDASAHAPDIDRGARRLAAAARARGLPMASHDDSSIAGRDAFRGLGARICEFPMQEEVGLAARAAGDAVVMGCPNVVRGGSHLGWASAAALAERGICTVLCSDYFYPAMLPAAFRLAGRLGLGPAWDLISRNPARAAGLHDRGEIAPGQRADLVLVDPAGPRVVAVIVAGSIAHLTAEGARRTRV